MTGHEQLKQLLQMWRDGMTFRAIEAQIAREIQKEFEYRRLANNKPCQSEQVIKEGE